VRKSTLWDNYDWIFKDLRGKKLRILEIGVSQGNSMKVWKDYFPKAKIVGVDIDESCSRFMDERVNICIGDQSDEDFMNNIGALGKYDIIVDDGGHYPKQHVKSYNILFPYLKDDGWYVIEDLHTAYWDEYGGNREGTSPSILMVKKMIDEVNASGRWMKNNPGKTTKIKELHAFNSIIFIKKWH